ncbi:MAG TPA: SRPBCC family protein [Acidimicrobiales bacterium]
MGRQHVDATAWSAAPPPAVYALLVDGSTWPSWSGHSGFELVERGEGDGDGVGAIRILHRGTMRSREQIVELVPDRRLGYTLLAGLALRDYRANVDLEPERGGTAIHWYSDFSAKVPGTGGLYRWALTRFVTQATASLAAHAAETARD